MPTYSYILILTAVWVVGRYAGIRRGTKITMAAVARYPHMGKMLLDALLEWLRDGGLK